MPANSLSLSGEPPRSRALDALIARFDAAKRDDRGPQEPGSAPAQRGHEQGAPASHPAELRSSIALRSHIESLHAAMGNAGSGRAPRTPGRVTTLEEAAALLARSFESEPLPGVGSSPWKALWESAQRFSEGACLPGHDFPFVRTIVRCVLCQQPLDPQSRSRFIHFDEFVRNDTQVRLQDAKHAYEQRVKVLRELTVSPEVVANNLRDLEDTSSDVVAERARNSSRSTRPQANRRARHCPMNGSFPRPQSSREQPSTASPRLATTAKAAAEELGNPEGIPKQLAALAARRADLELLEQVKKSRPAIVKEIARLKEREALETAKSAAATTGITKKILEFSEESITEVVRDTFTRETDRLRLERVTIARTRADKGSPASSAEARRGTPAGHVAKGVQRRRADGAGPCGILHGGSPRRFEVGAHPR